MWNDEAKRVAINAVGTVESPLSVESIGAVRNAPNVLSNGNYERGDDGWTTYRGPADCCGWCIRSSILTSAGLTQ